MSTQFCTLLGIFIALAMPLLVLSAPFHEVQEEMIENMDKEINRGEGLNYQNQQPTYSLNQDDDINDDDHFVLKKAADFEQILKPCNRMPASGRGLEYTDCVRNRMLLMGR